MTGGYGPLGRPAGGSGTDWALGVLKLGGALLPVLGICPGDEGAYAALATRLRRGGWKRTYPADWLAARWPVAPRGALDLVAGELVRLTTGTASVYAGQGGQALELTPMWRSTAFELRRAVVALVEPGTLDGMPEDMADDPEAAVRSIAALPRGLTAEVAVRFDVFTGPRP